MPEDENNLFDDDDDAGEGDSSGDGEKTTIDIVALLWKLHPFILLTLALGIAIFSYSLIPKKAKEKPKTLEYYYNRSRDALEEAGNPLLDHTPGQVQEYIQKAKTDFEYVFTHNSYKEQMSKSPSLLNPYMLFGVSLYMYGTNDLITQNKQATFQKAVWAFSQALEWETKHWDERQQKIYDTQYFTTGEAYDESILQARKLLRNQYLRYMLARSAIYAEQYYLAEKELENLIKEFQTENISGNNIWKIVESLPPHKYELLPEDRTLLYYFLGELNEKRDEIDNAEKYYRIFLLHAKRSNEFFQALMRLGTIYFNKAEQADDDNDIEEARRLYSEAAEVFSKVIAASPPANILRKAYFTGGKAYYNLALTIAISEKSIWDISEKFSDSLKDKFQYFTNGNPLPSRTLYVPAAIGRAVAQSALGSTLPLSVITGGTTGNALALLSEERLTPESEKRRLLWRANMYFSGSQGGKLQEYDGSANIMLARIHMINGNYADARKLLEHTRTYFWSPEIEIASKLGIAISYLMEGDLDRAYIRFTGGPEKISSSLLTESDIKSWEGLCETIYKNSISDKLNPSKRIWALLPKNMQDIIADAATTGRFAERYKPILIRRMNEILSSEEFYNKDYFEGIEPSETSYMLMENDIVLLTLKDRQWLNRMLLDATFRTYILPTSQGEIIEPFPSAAAFNSFEDSVLLTKNRIIQSLLDLSEKYTQRANQTIEEINRLSSIPNPETYRKMVASPRRDLEHTTKLNEFLINEYTPEYIGDIMMVNAATYRKRAQLAGKEPFRDMEKAKTLTAISADEYLKVGKSGKYLALEQKALIEAGRNYYAAGKYGKAAEALAIFVSNYPSSPQIGWASNLLGRCYWYLKRFNSALRVYRDNSNRRTPDGRNSLYYLGAVYLDAESLPQDNVMVDTVGNPDSPYAKENKDGDLYPDTALQVFNEVRRQEGISPASRPWRWATFGLGKVWFSIAEKRRQQELQKAETEARPPAAIEWRELYQQAARILREGLERYQLKYNNNDVIGIDLNEEPEDYYDVMRERMENEYFLALSLRVLSRDSITQNQDEAEVRQLFSNIISQEKYPNSMFEIEADKLLLSNRSVLGVNAGPLVRVRYLNEIRRSALFLLAESWTNFGRSLELKSPPDKIGAIEAYEKALQVYRLARDRLSIYDGPRVLYNMAETMIRLNKPDDARRIFLMVINQVDQINGTNNQNLSQSIKNEIADTKIWKELAIDRIRDLQNNLLN